MRSNREAKALTKALAPYRSGRQGELRARVRCMLVRIMGFSHCDDIPVGVREIPHRFPRRSGLELHELYELGVVAEDALRELDYQAAADILNNWRERHGMINLEVGAKEALENLESGPPSVNFDRYPVLTRSVRKYASPEGGQYIIGRHVHDGWWYRFAVGKSVHDRRGQWVGWDKDAGYTFQRRGRTLKDALAGLYGSAALTEKDRVT